MGGNLSAAATRSAQAQIAQLIQAYPNNLEGAIMAFQSANPTMTEADVTRLFQSVVTSSGVNAGSVVARSLPASTSSTPSMTDRNHPLSNPLVSALVTRVLTDELGPTYTALNQGSLMIYLDATVSNSSSGITMGSVDGVRVHCSGLGLSDAAEQALVSRIQSVLQHSTELESFMVDLGSKVPKREGDTQIHLASDVRFWATPNLQEPFRLPPRGTFSPSVGQMIVTGRGAEGVHYTRTFDDIMIAPVGFPGMPQPGERSAPFQGRYHPVPYIAGSAYHEGCGYVMLATLEDSTSTPNEILRSFAFTRAGQGYISFAPPQGIVMSGS